MHKFACWYGRWLSTSSEPEGRTPIGRLIVLCSIALLFALMCGFMAYDAMRQGVPWNGTVHYFDRHNQPDSYPVLPFLVLSIVLSIVFLPLLLSVIAYLRGWFGANCDGDE